MKLPV